MHMTEFNKKTRPIYAFAILLVILGFVPLEGASSPRVVSAATINVPDDYERIQWAIGNASVEDTIFVKAGTYYENVVIDKSLTLRGAGSDITIIDGGGTKAGVKITADSVNINGFTIRNSGDGIHLNKCAGVIVGGNKITSNKNDGIYVESSINNIISGNTISSNDLGGLFIEDSTGNTINDNVVASNSHEGVYVYYSSNNTVNSNTIISHINWPAISLEGSDSNIVSNNTISRNKIGIGLYEGSDSNTIVSNTISESEYVGIEIFFSGGNLFHHNNLIGNRDHVYPDGANTWDNGAEGNYWSDYNGTGPYVIDSYNQDRYPLVNPYDETKPVADAGLDQLVAKGTTVTFDGSGSTDNLDIVNYGIVNYTWTFTDNTTKVLTGIQANYTFYNIGNFSVTLNISDYSSNWSIDKTWINVTETQLIRNVAIASVAPYPTTVITGSLLLVNVTVTNEGNMNETFDVTVYYDSSIVGRKNVTSLASGTNKILTFEWTTTGVPGGNYTIKAVAGILIGETYIADNERTADSIVTVKKLGSIISIFVNPTSVTVGLNITIDGNISPVRANVNVTIEYRPTNENWTGLVATTTNSESKYSYDWMTTEPGNYEIRTSWSGDANTLANVSNVWSVTIKDVEDAPTDEQPATNIHLYAVATAVIIIVLATVVYVLKARRQKPTLKLSEQKLNKLFPSFHGSEPSRSIGELEKIKLKTFRSLRIKSMC